MPLHDTAKTVLELMQAVGLDVGPETTPQQVRDNMARATAAMPRLPVFDVQDRALPTPVREIPVRVYRPSDAPGLGLLVWLHGGGWVIGSLDTHDQLCRLLCEDAQVMVMSVDYRLAPEARFPAGLDDCLAAWEWVCGHAADLGADADRLALGGDSAGGNLAAVTCLVARDRGLPQPRLEVLVYPVTDYEFDSPSMRDNGVGYFLQADHMRWFFGHYTRSEDERLDWRVSPLRAADVSRVAPAVVVTAELDPLRDQGEAYGRRLQEAGVPAEIVRMDGTFHGTFAMHDAIETVRDPWRKTVAAVRAAIGDG